MRSCKFSIDAIFDAFNFVELTLLIGLQRESTYCCGSSWMGEMTAVGKGYYSGLFIGDCDDCTFPLDTFFLFWLGRAFLDLAAEGLYS